MDKIEQARRAGMLYAYQIAKEKGIDGLKKEIEFRNITKCPLNVPREKFNEFVENVKKQTVDSIICLSLVTLRDEFDFGGKRLRRFWDRFMLKSECLAEDYVAWDDYIVQLDEECGLKIEIRKNDKNVVI